MPDYRRLRTSAATYFFTVNLHDRRSDLLTTHIGLLRASVARVRHLMPFHIDAWVVLPDHMHALWTLPEGDANFSRRWQAIKMAFSREVRGERGIWQRRFWEHTIRDEHDYAAHVDYVHFNPVKHGLAASAAAWPHSTFHRAVAQGRYPSAWSADDRDDGPKGER